MSPLMVRSCFVPVNSAVGQIENLKILRELRRHLQNLRASDAALQDTILVDIGLYRLSQGVEVKFYFLPKEGKDPLTVEL